MRGRLEGTEERDDEYDSIDTRYTYVFQRDCAYGVRVDRWNDFFDRKRKKETEVRAKNAG